jgi:hypothetical protein
MEIDPAKQKTLPDFAMTEQLWGVRAIDIRAVAREGNALFYNRDGRPNEDSPHLQSRHSRRPRTDGHPDSLRLSRRAGRRVDRRPRLVFRISKFSLPG